MKIINWVSNWRTWFMIQKTDEKFYVLSLLCIVSDDNCSARLCRTHKYKCIRLRTIYLRCHSICQTCNRYENIYFSLSGLTDINRSIVLKTLEYGGIFSSIAMQQIGCGTSTLDSNSQIINNFENISFTESSWYSRFQHWYKIFFSAKRCCLLWWIRSSSFWWVSQYLLKHAYEKILKQFILWNRISWRSRILS